MVSHLGARAGLAFGWLVILGLLVGCLYTAGAAVTLSTDTQIAAGDTSYDGVDLVVDRCTVTIAGSHSFRSLTLANEAVVTHPSCKATEVFSLRLTITGELAVDATSRIDANGRGYLAGRGEGNGTEGVASGQAGGSYGGIGGGGFYGEKPGRVYGDYRNPTEPGSGGGLDAAGGGFVWIEAGSIRLDGVLRADGVRAAGNRPGSSGGGMRIKTGTLAGAGAISVNGGSGDWDGGSGAGGRVAVYYSVNNSFDLSKITAYGGPRNRGGQGGCGSVYLEQTGNAGLLRLSNGGFTDLVALTPLGLAADARFQAPRVEVVGTNLVTFLEHPMPATMDSLSVLTGACLTHQRNTDVDGSLASLDLTVKGEMLVDEGSRVDANGRGYLAGRGSGNVTATGTQGAAGGSYAGIGGNGYYGGAPNPVYGDYWNPTEPGAGSGADSVGGGLLRITAGNLRVDGVIRADGVRASGNRPGGAGGGIRLDVGALSGSGSITANGGAGEWDGGGGGGGRVALYYSSASGFDLNKVTAYGGGENRSGQGGCGSVYLKPAAGEGTLRLSNGGSTGRVAYTPLGLASDASFAAEKLQIIGTNLVVYPEHHMPVRANRLFVQEGAKLTHLANSETNVNSLLLTVTNELVVDGSSTIDVSGKGFKGGFTLGNSNTNGPTERSGGSYGGLGGAGYYGGTPNAVYGDYRNPNELGTGAAIGGAGGGLARISADTLQLDGAILANGVGPGGNAAGGSGGGIRLDVRALSGTGTIRSHGGYGDWDGGSGSGGRVAIYCDTAREFDLARVTAYPGDAPRSSMGGAGTIYFKETGREAVLRIDNGNLAAKSGYTPLGVATNSVFEAEALVLFGTNVIVLPEHQMPVRVNNLSVLSGAVLKHYETTADAEYSLGVTVTNAMVIDATSKVDVSGCGYLAGRTEGNAPAGAATERAGGSYGGLGGAGHYGGVPNRVYGDYRDPNHLGSGASLGSSGGGLVRISARTLTLDGAIRADSFSWGRNYAAGSGGGIRLDVATISGSGLITANGGAGDWDGGGGGGGRVAIYASAANTFPVGNIQAYGGYQSRSQQGGAGSIFLKTADQPGELRLNNGGATERAGVVYLGTAGDAVFRADRLIVSGTNLVVMPEHQMAIDVGELSLLNGAMLTHLPVTGEQVHSLDVRVAGAFTIDAASKINVAGRGYLPGRTVGNTTEGAAGERAGGSYGGLGGRGYYGGIPNRVYGDYRNPNEHGTGGSIAGVGGGLVRIRAGSFLMDGLITANGVAGGGNRPGGSGGGVRIETGTMNGRGVISVDGGTGDWDGGAGGGGRVAIHYGTDGGFAWTNVTAYGGYASRSGLGGAGTVFFQQSGKEGFLLVDNRVDLDKRGTTPLGIPTADDFKADNVVISGTNTTVIPEHPMMLQMRNLSVVSGALVTHPPTTAEAEYYLALTVRSNFLLDATSSLDVNALGYLPGRIAGNETDGAAVGNAGGSHGGLGGAGYYGGTPNAVYDESRGPTFPGAGSGNGGRGGGVIRLSAGQAQVDGTITANGVGGGGNTAGGSGGSVLLNVLALSGAGAISANGGPGDWDGGGGGGGRVALYALANSLPATNVTANGGAANRSQPGAPGTVFYGDSPYFLLNEPVADAVVHDTVALRWNALGLGATMLRADLIAYRNGVANRISIPADAQGDGLWDTTLLPDGRYDLKVVFSDADTKEVLGDASRQVTVLNNGVWHSGTITNNETWAAGEVHIVEKKLIIPSGVTVTIQPGAGVKFAKGASIAVQAGGTLAASGAESSKVVFTAISDDSVGGDTNLDGDKSRPQPGEWGGVTVAGDAAFSYNEFTDIRYVSSTHSGTVASSQTWLGTFLHHVTGDVVVPSGVTLTIQPGAVVKLNNDKSIVVQSGGRLEANGTLGLPIIFTSIKDDTVGGDTNGDGDQTTPAGGDWHWILLDSGAAQFNYCQVRYGGGPEAGGWGPPGGPGKASLKTQGGASLVFSNSVMADSYYDGILSWGGPVKVANSIFTGIDRALCAHPGSVVTVVNSTLENNRVGLLIHGGEMIATNVIVANSGAAGILHDYGPDALTIASSDLWNPSASDGNYSGTEDQTGKNGNISADPKFKNAESRNYRLNYGSPCLDAANGLAAPATDFMAAPRYTDPRSQHTGIKTALGAYADMGAFEFVEMASSDLDLIAYDITGPAQVTAGEPATIRWKVRNIGTAKVSATWHNAIGLASEGASAGAELIDAGEASSTGVLGPNQEASFSALVRAPGAAPGNWRWAVRVNNRGDVFEGINWTNNLGLAVAGVDVRIPALVVGAGAQTLQVATGNESHWFKVEVPPGRDVLVTLQDLSQNGAVELYAGRDYVPTLVNYDQMETSQAGKAAGAVVSGGSGATAYLLAYARSLPGGAGTFKIEAKILDFSLTGIVSSRKVGNSGPVTFHITGGQLGANIAYQLVGQNGQRLDAKAVYAPNSSEAFVTFDLQGSSPGAYSLSAVQGGHALSLANAVEVVAGGAAVIDVTVSSPANIRPFRQGTVVIEYRNNGSVDAVAPLLGLKAANASLISPSQKYHAGPNLLLLGVNLEGPAGILPPGAGGKISVPFTSQSGGDCVFEVWAAESPGDSMNWDALKGFCKPFFLGSEAFDVIWYNFLAKAGSTVGQFNALLAEQATRLSRLGVTVVEAQQLMGFAMQDADQYGAVSRRFVLGGFGQGWMNPLDIVAHTDARQNVYVRVSGLPVRFFRYINASLFTPVPGDHGVLRKVNDHYELSEPDGWVWMFHPDGRLAYAEDSRHRRLTYNYTQDVVTSVSDSMGDVYSFAYNQGRITGITDPVGRVATLTYEGAYLASIGATDGTVTRFDYVKTPGDAARHALKTISLPDGVVVSMTYDGRGALQRISRSGSLGGVDLSSAGPGELTLNYADQGTVKLLWDHFGGLRRMVDALGRTTQLRFDDSRNLLEVAGPNGLRRTMRYDGMGNLVSLADPAGDRVDLTHDATFNQPTSFRSARGAVTTFDYDDQANVRQITYPDGQRENFTFGAQGVIGQAVNARGQAIKYTTNTKGLVTRKELADGSAIAYEYDAHRNVTKVTQTAGGQARVTTMSYDNFDRLIRLVYPDQRALEFAYDAAGRRTRVSTQDGFVVNYAYNADGRLSQLTDGQGRVTAAYSYDVMGRLAEVRKGDGVTTRYEYDVADQLLRLENRAAGGTVLSRFEYSYDAQGRRHKVVSLEGTTEYGYDDAGRLTRVSLPGGRMIEYAYDADGNRVSAIDNGQATYSVVNEVNQLLTSGPASLRYDADGNLVSRQDGFDTSSFEYDTENRLVGASTPEGRWVYEYDAFGQLAAATRDGQRTEFLNDPMGDGNVIAEYSGGTLLANYTHGVGLVSMSPSGQSPRYYLYDGTGHASELVDAAGVVANRYRFLPFGEALSAEETVPNAFKFGAQYGLRDNGAGLVSMRARFYSPDLGRFISRDPAFADPVNAYIYAGNDPVNFYDATGTTEEPLGQRYTTPTTEKLVNAAEYAKKGLGVAKWYRESRTGKTLVGQLQNSIRFGNYNRSAIENAISQNARVVQKLEVVGSALEIGISGYKALASIQDYRRGVGSGDQVIHDLGQAAGNILSVYVPVLKPMMKVTEFVSSHSGPLFDWWYGDSHKQLEEMNNRLRQRKAGCRSKLVQSWDPNDITGPAGYGSQSYVMVDRTMNYLIQFENKSNALAAAQMVFVTNKLAASLDYSTFELGNIGFGTNTIVVPKGRQTYWTRFDDTERSGLYVDVSVSYDVQLGFVLWTLIAVDPVTLNLPEDPLAGFLPPNRKAPMGEGWMRYSVRPLAASTNNTLVPALASIVFDDNPRIDTPAIKNTLDATAPSSAVEPLPATSPASFTVAWSGQDSLASGVVSYDIYVSADGGNYTLWLGQATNTSALFQGSPGVTYAFYSIARDGVGYQEAPPAGPDAMTKVQSSLPQLSWSLAEGRVTIAWPKAGADFRLESRDALEGAGGWQPASETVTAVGEVNTISPAPGLSRRFYRLHKQ
jgi:RHS repeat-associated protein